MMEEVGASFAGTIHIGEIALKNRCMTANSNDVDMATKEAIAVRFMRGSNKHHQAFLQELRNQYLNKQDWYPSTLSEAYNVMLRIGDRVQYIPTSDGLTFTTAGTTRTITRTTTEHDCGTTLATQGENSHASNNIIAGTDGRIHENVKCYGCNNYGHYQSHCPQTTDTRHVENSSSRFYLISCSQGILNSSRLSCYLLLRLLVYMYLSQLMRTFTNYLKCIVISS